MAQKDSGQCLKIKIDRFKRDHSFFPPKRKYYKIFILTNDDYYFIIEKRKLYKSLLFKHIFDSDKTSGNINNPLFLKKQNSKYVKIIIEYLDFYYNKIDFFEPPVKITYNNINYYFNNFDKKFFSKFQNLSIGELQKITKKISYFNIYSLTQKFHFLLFLKNNQDKINN